MICPNCSKEIPDNNAYCIYCHAPLDIDDIDLDINILEDDELREEYISNKNKEEKKNKKINKKLFFIIGFGVLILVCFITLISSMFLNSNNSVLNKANNAYEEKAYDQALELYKSIIKKGKSGDIADRALLGAGRCCMSLKDYDSGIEYLCALLDRENVNDSVRNEAFELLLDMYIASDQQELIQEAGDKYATSSALKKIFDEKAVDTPEFSESEGEFTDDINLILTSKGGNSIYYTINGDDPSKGNGKLYEREILISEGTTVVKACCFKDNVFGPVAQMTYTIVYDNPDFPEVTPLNGTFNQETRITITSNTPNSKIYYTWDGSTPTASSSRYTEPILIPEGNNILSVVVISESGKSSEVLTCSYTYLPAF